MQQTTTRRRRRIRTVAPLREVSRYWSVRFQGVLGLLFVAAGAGWMALDKEERAHLLTLFRVAAEDQPGVLALIAFGLAATNAATIALRAIKQSNTGTADRDQVPQPDPDDAGRPGGEGVR